MSLLRRSASMAIPAVVVIGFGAAPAQADTGLYCDNYYDNCGAFYFNSNTSGSHIVFTGLKGQQGSIPDLAPYKFLGPGNGKGQSVKNNAASFYNGSFQITTVFFNSNYSGPCDSFEPHATAKQLRNTYNENASLGFGRSGVNCYKFN
ncbi:MULTISPECIES: peptidase inhibitor family I36 protein [unclassified Streptomyces]|uniref:peptidase inhibitor family I36 protein n=1 Tax=unclassified Streptomyces TaxID=2593676 RepID=UPI0006AFF875|nr:MULTISPECIES: peptidase inhibitor family I36 protein [unclassified Streptomyces]KOX35755.1 hypothetical protein ADL06_05770 [Streptomyces sp. NRRL F-6491]KOX41382.1 hypothetical protein ADL08_19310 [Streptomyces sp. NRRL F-6492]